MDKSINFYELKTELADLGYNDPEIVEQLRQAMADGDDPRYLIWDPPIGAEKLHVVVGLERSVNDRVIIGYFDAHITVGGDRDKLRMQFFEPDVHFEQVVQLLTERSKYPELDEIVIFAPMTAAEVDESLKALALPVLLHQISGPIQQQLKTIGFDDPGIIACLQQKIIDRQQRFYLSAEVRGDGGDFRYCLNFRPDENGKLSFDYYQGYIWPHDPRIQEELRSGADQYKRGQNFEPDVPIQLATQLFQSRLPLKKDLSYEELKPLTADEVRALLTINNKIMNTQNLEQLQKPLKNLGFGEKLNDQLEKNIKAEMPEFTLNAQHEFNQKKFDYTLHFRAGDERYFFNSFEARILNADPAKEVKQTFKINKGNGMTAKEAFNLMEGRAVEKLVFKDDERYHAWFQLDQKNFNQNGDKQMKQFHENYGYDIEKVLLGHGIKEMNETKSTDELLYSLKKGNVQQIHVEKNGKEQKYFVSANPQFKTVDLFDHQMKKIKREELIGTDQKQGKDIKQGNEQKEGQTEKKQTKRSKKITA
jgi:hypothetical protein